MDVRDSGALHRVDGTLDRSASLEVALACLFSVNADIHTSPTRQRGTLVLDVTLWQASSSVLRWRVRLVYSPTSKSASVEAHWC
jgi:hypothetical protein